MKNNIFKINICIILGLFFCLPMSLTAAPNNNQIFYTSSDGDVVTPYDTKVFGVNIVSNEYKDGLGIITFDGNVRKIGEYAFNSRSRLISIELPNSVTTIENYAFYNCSEMTTITLPSSLTFIGQWTFSYCSNLSSIICYATKPPVCDYNCFFALATRSVILYVPKESISVYRSANRWRDFTNILSIEDSKTISGTCGADLTWKLTCDSVLTISGTGRMDDYSLKDKQPTSPWAEYMDAIDSIYISEGVTTVGAYAFKNASNVSGVFLPTSLDTIYRHAFDGCQSLVNFILPKNLQFIDANAFYSIGSISKLVLPSTLTYIGSAGISCGSLTELTCLAENPPYLENEKSLYSIDYSIPLYVPYSSIEAYKQADIWQNFTNIQPIGGEAPKNNIITYTATGKLTETISSSSSGIHTKAFNAAITSHTFSNGIGTITFVSDVTTIGENAFYKCSGLTSITIPNSVTTIGDQAFRECSDLISIMIPNSVTTIGNFAFFNCSKLTSVKIGNSVITIEFRAFYGCSSLPIENNLRYADTYLVEAVDKTLSSYTIKEGTKWIGDEAFYCCSYLTSVTIPSSVTTIGEDAFYNCFGLASIIIPNSVITIEYAAFRGCSGLTSITIGNSVTTIGDNAFYQCKGLTSITIPSSVTSIGNYAFFGCTGLTSITCEAVTPPTCGTNCFLDVSTSIPLYVPKGSVDAYKKADQWSDFTNIQPIGGGDDCKPISGTCGANLTWTLTCDSILTISGKGRMNDYPLKDKQLTSPWAEYISAIDSIYISEGVTTIGEYAFRDASNVSGVFLPTSLDSIHTAAFDVCIGLTSITIPHSVKSIGEWTFFGCSSLTSAIIGNSVTSIGDHVFALCSSLASVTISNSVITIGEEAFYKCSSLTSITIPNSVTSIGKSAFKSCSNLTSMTIPNSVTTIEPGTFYDCRGLTSVTIGNSVKTIGGSAFCNCNHLTSVTIPNSVTAIGNEAFYNCRLNTVTIGNSVKTIGGAAFANCTGLTSITCEAVTPPTCGSDCFYNIDKSIPLYVPAESVSAYQKADIWKNFTNIQPIGGGDDCKPISGTCGKNLTWTLTCDSVLTISGTGRMNDYPLKDKQPTSPWAEYMDAIDSVYISEGVTTIGKYAFRNASNVTGVFLPASLDTIHLHAFYGCKSLVNFILPEGLQSIELNAFYNIGSISKLVLPSTLAKIGASGIYCRSLTELTCLAEYPPYLDSEKSLYNIDYSIPLYVPYQSIDTYKQANIWKNFTNIQPISGTEPQNNVITYTASSKLNEITGKMTSGLHTNAFNVAITSHTFSDGVGTITFAGDVTTIGDYAFCWCSSLTSINLPNSVTTIGEDAFYYCQGLTSITIPNSVTTIGVEAFFGCSGFTSITIPNSVTTIGVGAFRNCTGLTSVAIGKSVTAIEDFVFFNCTKLTTINVDIDNTHFCSLDGVLFNYAKDTLIQYPVGNTRTEYAIPNSVKTIREGVFGYCKDLTSITIPNSVTTISACAFSDCSGLESITIPNSVTTIGMHAFSDCTGLTSLTCEAVTPPSCGTDCFDGVTTSIPVYVPAGSVDAYKNTYPWSEFTNIQPIPNNVITYKATSKLTETTKWDSYGLHTDAFNVVITSHVFANGTGTITFDGDVTTIGDYAFKECSGLTSITIPTSATTIGKEAFRYCSGLTSVTIPNSVTTIGESAFEHCWGLTSIEIPNSVTTIGGYAFYYCSGLTSITIPNSVTTIRDYAFYGCSSLPVEDNLRYADTYLVDAVDNTLSSYTIKEGTKWIGACAFSDCSGLESITIPNSVISIGYWAFRNCRGLTSITIPNSVIILGSNAFEDCRGLKSITIPNSVITIGSYTFYDCENLASVTIGNSVTSIGMETFSGCPVERTNYTGTIADWCKISFGSYNANPIYKSHHLYINDIEVTDLVIPTSVTTIGKNAFCGYSGLTSITCEAVTPPACGSDCFYNVSKATPLYVPERSISAYKKAYGWKNFYNIQPIGGEEDPGNTIKNTTTTISELEAWVTVPLDAKGEVTKYSYWLYLDNAHTDLVCSMDFDAAGKMSNPVIRKAPTQQQAEEEQTFDSFTFEVSGLEANTTYYYVLKAFTNAKTFTKEGSFTTQSSAVRKAPSQVRKVCKQNQILFEVDGNTYDIWGNKH